MSRQHQHNCFDKNEICITLKLFLTLTARKNCLYSLVWKTETLNFGIMIFWVVGKNCIVKNEKCIVFPESWYINLNPEMHKFLWYLAVVIISLTHMLPAWLLALTLYMWTSIHIFCGFLVLNSNYCGWIPI